jgi:serine/threonine-protein kinase
MTTSYPDDAFEEIVDTSRFRIVRKLAQGGMGAVYEAVLCGPMSFTKTVAIKTIVERYSQDEEFVEMFIGEARLVSDLVHPNICQVYQLGKVANLYYIAMEYIAGVTLQQFVERHGELGTRVPVDIGTFIISRVCRGLEYAHAKRDRNGHLLGVVHRDVSPRNIMISTEGEVKLTDFGVAKAHNLLRDREGEVVMGQAPYVSPEQLQRRPTDARSDLFSLGVVMFELLSGQSLFKGPSTSATLKNVLVKEIPSMKDLNPEITPQIERIARRAVERDLTRRYQSGSEMGYDLEYAIYHEGYGPTIVTLEKHLRRIFPGLSHTASDPERSSVAHRNEGTTLSFPTD